MSHEKRYNLIALLPMKAHSERVRGKNFRELGGKPLFSWMLETLLSISRIELVVINTDARELLLKFPIINNPKVFIRDRKREICGDFVSMNLILEDDIQAVSADNYLMTHTTNPFLSAKTINLVLDQYLQAKQSRNADSLFTVDKVQARFYRHDCSAVNHDPKNLLRTQDLEPWYRENSNLYLFSRESFSKTRARIGEKPLMFEVPKLESLDIDDADDWKIAEAISKGLIHS